MTQRCREMQQRELDLLQTIGEHRNIVSLLSVQQEVWTDCHIPVASSLANMKPLLWHFLTCYVGQFGRFCTEFKHVFLPVTNAAHVDTN